MDSYEEKRAHALQLANKRRSGGKLAFLAHWARIVVLSLALFVVIRAFGVEAFKIASGSMEHTLFEGDFRWQKAYLVGGASIENYHPSRNNWGPLVVPPHDYFVLGDNRDNSSDSRYWGFVADSLVRGQPIVVYYSYAPDTGDRLDWLTRLRWKRFGEIVH